MRCGGGNCRCNCWSEPCLPLRSVYQTPAPFIGSPRLASAPWLDAHPHSSDVDSDRIKTRDDVGFEVAQLGRPGPVIDVDDQDAITEMTWYRVVGDSGTDEARPVCHHRRHRLRIGYSDVTRDALKRVAQPVWLISHRRQRYRTAPLLTVNDTSAWTVSGNAPAVVMSV